MLQPKVFKAYDVRGVYGVDWDAEGAARVARGFIEEFGIKQLVLGWDMRISSPEMVVAIEAAAIAAGVHVVKVGCVTTPMLYFATAGYPGNDGGIMITASHNTGEWNGMKMLLGNGMPVGEASGLVAIKERACAGNFVAAPHPGTLESRDVMSDCFDKVFSITPLGEQKDLSVVIDCGNGMEGAVIHTLLSRLPMVRAHVMYDTPDGTFPHHEANPLKEETLEDLKREVVARGADLGVAFDGDGDRIGFVDERGEFVSADVLAALVARELLKDHPGATIMYDLRSRRVIDAVVKAAGGKTEMSRIGHAFIKKQMRESGALFASELSGHFYFQDYFNVECSEVMMLLVLRLLQNSNKKLSQLAASMMVDAHSGEINFTVADRDGALHALEAAYGPHAKAVSKIDGLLFDMGDWWFSVRASNTEPLLRLNLEAHDPGLMKEKIKEVQSFISR